MVPAIVILVEFRKEPLWFTPWICETLGTDCRHQKESGETKVAPPTLIEKGSDKRKRIVPSIGIAVAALTIIVLIGILVFPSSPLKTLFVNANSEVIIPPNDGKQTTT